MVLTHRANNLARFTKVGEFLETRKKLHQTGKRRGRFPGSESRAPRKGQDPSKGSVAVGLSGRQPRKGSQTTETQRA